ncbi:MAG: hypothetical protein AAFS10_16095 [Myxococcota bacterium]
MVDPTEATLLRELSRLYGQYKRPAHRHNVVRTLEALGLADGQHLAWLASLQARSPSWIGRPQQPLTVDLIEQLDANLLEDFPEIHGLRHLAPLLLRLYPTPQRVLPPLEPQDAPDLHALVEELVAWMGVSSEVREQVEPVASKTGLSLALNLPHGARIQVAVDPGRNSDAGLRFRFAAAFDMARRELLPFLATPPQHTAHMIELLVRLQEGESMEGLRREPHLRGVVRKMQAEDLTLFKGAVVRMSAHGVAQPVFGDDGESAVDRGRRIRAVLEQASDRVALIATHGSDLAACVQALHGPEEAPEDSPRVRNLLRFYLSEEYFAARARVGRAASM